jgi:LacI family transcriptional regulator
MILKVIHFSLKSSAEMSETKNAPFAIALVLPLQFEFGRNVRAGVLERAVGVRGVHLVDCDPRMLETLKKDDLFDGFDGVIAWVREDGPLAGRLAHATIPLVYCGLNFGDVAGLPAVAVDRASIHRLAILHFREIGLENFALLRSSLHLDQPREKKSRELRSQVEGSGMRWREHAYRDELAPFRPGSLWEGHRNREFSKFLRGLPKPCGILAVDDDLAVMAARTALHLGFRVPEDLAVLGQGDRISAMTSDPAISSIPFPGKEVGRVAFDRLMEWLGGTKPAKSINQIPCVEVSVRESTRGCSRDLAMERARRYMEANAFAGVRLKEIATVAECSPNTFVARFRELHGSDPVTWLRERRLAEACRLMEESDLAIGEVSRRCGFTSVSNFVNFFQRQMGMSPGSWRSGGMRGNL